MRVTIKSIERTCIACPSQWEAETDDGRVVYIRYRFGKLTVGIGATLSDAVGAGWSHPKRGELLLVHNDGSELGGDMDFDEMRDLTSDVLDFGGVTPWPCGLGAQRKEKP